MSDMSDLGNRPWLSSYSPGVPADIDAFFSTRERAA